MHRNEAVLQSLGVLLILKPLVEAVGGVAYCTLYTTVYTAALGDGGSFFPVLLPDLYV